MNELENLVVTLNDNSLTDDERTGAIDTLDELNDPQAVVPLIDALKNDKNSLWLKTRVAICLGNHAVDKAVPQIISIIKDPSSAGFRGSFIFALWSLNCVSYLPFIAETLATDTYETTHHCCHIIRQYASKIISPLKDEMLEILNKYRIIYETGSIPPHSLSTNAESTLGFIELAIELIEEGAEYHDEEELP